MAPHLRGAWRRALFVLAAVLASALVLAALHPARAAYPVVDVFVLGAGGNCTTTSCSSSIHTLCRNSGTATTAFACNSSTLKYDIALSAAIGGSNQQVQFNSSGTFAGDSGLVFNPGNDQLTIAGLMQSTGIISTAGASIAGALAVTSGGAAITGASSVAGNLAVTSGGATITGASSVAGNLDVTGGDVSVASGQKVCLDGASCTAYLQRNADTGCVQSFKDGALEWQFCGTYAVPPPCGAQPERMPFGAMCLSYSNGMAILQRTARGIERR